MNCRGTTIAEPCDKGAPQLVFLRKDTEGFPQLLLNNREGSRVVADSR